MTRPTVLRRPQDRSAGSVERARTVDPQVRTYGVRIGHQPGPPAAETVPRSPAGQPVRRRAVAVSGLAVVPLVVWALFSGSLVEALPEPATPAQLPGPASPGPPPQPTPGP